MTSEKTLRFLRALALLSSGAALSCGGKTDDGGGAPNDGATENDSSTTNDSSSPNDTATADDTTTTDVNAPEVPAGDGDCHQPLGTPADLPCAPGSTCEFPLSATTPSCSVSAIAGSVACGAISCAQDCYCNDAANSICFCTHAVTGPLPPPDLPRA